MKSSIHGLICEQKLIWIIVKEKYFIAYKEMQNIPIWNFSLKFKFHSDISDYCIVGLSQYTIQRRLLS